MSRTPFNPETGQSYRRLRMCFACIHNFHLSCGSADCTCRKLEPLLHSSAQSSPIPHPAPEAQHQAQLAGEAIAS
jgi:hypothetical protein